MTTTLFVLLGAGTGGGLWLLVRGLTRAPAPPRFPGVLWRRRGPREPQTVRATVAAGAGVAAGVVTGWVAGAVLAALAAWSLPRLLARDRNQARRVERIEAIATWAEMMRDTLAAAAGLEQAVLASAAVAPAAIHPEITGLAVRIEAGQRLAPSLRTLADELGDPTADLVISSLLLASTQHARNLGELLGSLANTAREQASMRLRINAGRARARTSVRIIIATTLGFAGMLILLNRDYLSVYDSPAGQLMLLAIGLLFAAGFTAMARIAVVDEPARVLAPTGPHGPGTPRGKGTS